jgi:hypothetical protein
MPTRYLKPGVRDSESIEALSANAEILYYRLIVTVDDFGRYDARPSMVKAACFPIREAMSASKVEALLKELSEHGLIVVYQVEGKPYIQLCKWDNVPRAKESKYPALENGCIQMYADVCSTNTDAPLTVTVTKTQTVTKTTTAPEGVSSEVWDSFVKHRKSKGAQITPLVMQTIEREAAKAGWSMEAALTEVVVRNWQSFKAKWVDESKANSTETAYQKTQRETMEGLAPGISRKTPFNPATFEVENVTIIESR